MQKNYVNTLSFNSSKQVQEFQKMYFFIVHKNATITLTTKHSQKIRCINECIFLFRSSIIIKWS